MRTLLVACLLGIAALLHGQQYDAQWTIGVSLSVVDFRNDIVQIDSIPLVEYFTQTNACICDESGNLIYYTNGISICNIHDTLLNGNGLSPCAYTDAYGVDGLNISQAAIFIPKPGSNRYYYLFHFSNDTFQDSRPGIIYYTLIDKEGDNGKGEVIQKNVPIIRGHIMRGGGMTACKHANGRDYWLIMGGSVINRFYKFLITPDSILGPFTQDIGPEYPLPLDLAYSKFSQDGSKFATGAIEGLITIMDFDRCSGEFSSPITIFNNVALSPDTAISGCGGVEISPNNRFVYVADENNLVQYDLQSGNIQDSIQLFTIDSNTEYGIDFLQVAPNGRIYGSTWGGGLSAIHVINHPDLKGDSAGFVYGGQPTYTINSLNLPNLINYKLGPLIGSGCDTIKTDVEEPKSDNQHLRILPNPADKYVYVEMGMQGNFEFDLIDINGKLIDKRQTPQIDIFDTEHLPAGNYFLSVKDKTTNTEIATKKVVVMH